MNNIVLKIILLSISIAVLFAFIFWTNSMYYPQIQFSNKTTDYLELQNICLDKGYENISQYMPSVLTYNIIAVYCKDDNGQLNIFEVEIDEENQYYLVGEDIWVANIDGGRKIDAILGLAEGVKEQ